MRAKNIFNGLAEEHSNFVPIFYRGPINSSSIDCIGGYIRKILHDKPETSFKLFSIFIELAQNIYFHSDDSPSLDEMQAIKYGVFLIEESTEHFTIAAGNYATMDRLSTINLHCNKINSLSVDELRLFKRQRRMMERGEHGEANIGLIQIALTSEMPIFFDSFSIDEQLSFFTLSTDVKKNKQ